MMHRIPRAARRKSPALFTGLFIAILLAGITPPAARAGAVIYVKPNGTGGGGSWADATNLQSALEAAAPGDEIWVQVGTYTPGSQRSDTFRLKSSVALYGGFAGTETTRAERDWATNRTILSGEIGAAGSADNSYHVVNGSATNAGAVLDGFVIEGGNADGGSNYDYGGGLYNNNGGDPTIRNCLFRNNHAAYGGAIANLNGSEPALVNVALVNNSATRGGGLYNNASSPALTNLTFTANSASYGGGIYNFGDTQDGTQSNPAVRNAILWGDSATISGAEFFNVDSTPTVIYSIVQGGHPGAGNLDADPRFVDANGADNLYGTDDDNLRLDLTSPAVEAGDNSALPADPADLDGDGDILENLPVDLGRAARRFDVLSITDTGSGAAPVVDLGAYEAISLHAPAVSNFTRSALEDNAIPFSAVDFTGHFSDADSGDSLGKVKITSLPANGTLRLSSAPVSADDEIAAGSLGNLTFTPDANWNGSTSFGWNAADRNNAYSAAGASATLPVSAVNDAPSFTKGADQLVAEDSGPRAVSGWATDIQKGPPDESGQTVTFLVSNNNNGLFSAQPAVAADGSLTFTSAANANGSATVTVRIRDNGGTANGGVDTSAPQTFTITVSAVNDAPFQSLPAAQSVNEDTNLVLSSANGNPISIVDVDAGSNSLQVTLSAEDGTLTLAGTAGLAFSAGDGAGDASMTFTGTAGSCNAALNGLTFSPAADYFGPASLTLLTSDQGYSGSGGPLSDSETLAITVNPVNDAPGFTKGADQSVPEDSPAQSVNGWASQLSSGPANESGQSLDFLVTNDANALFDVQPAIDANGRLTYTPKPDASGTASVSVRIHDSGGTAGGGVDTSPDQTFSITLQAVNDAPVLDSGGSPSLDAIREDPASNGGMQAATLMARLGGSGITDLDGGALAGLAVTGVNGEHGTWQFSLDCSTDWTGFGSPTAESARLLASEACIRFSPDADWNGTVDPGITFRAWDRTSGANGGTADATTNGGTSAFSSAAETASILISPVNDAPAFTPGGNLAIDEDAGPQSEPGWASGMSPGPTNEAGQTLSFSLSNDNHALFLTRPALDAGSGNLTYTPAADAFGEASVTVTLSDNGGTANGGTDHASRVFTITINAVNDPPSLDAIEDQSIRQYAAPLLVDLTGIGTGAANETQTLTVTATTDDAGVAADPEVIYTSPQASGALRITPGDPGVATMTVVVDDGQAVSHTITRTFTVTVIGNLRPSVEDFSAGTNEDSPIGFQETDFSAHFTDGDGDALSLVMITRLPEHGALNLDGAKVFLNQEIPAAELDSLAYLPSADWHGADSFGWNGSDGAAYADVAADANLAVSAQNDAPVLSTVAVSGLEDGPVTFAAGDFTGHFTDVDGDALMAIRILSLPGNGSLTLDGSPVGVDQVIPAAELDELAFTPDPDWNGTAGFSWNGTDGSLYSASEEEVAITILPINDAPAFTAGDDQTAPEDGGPQTVNGWATGIDRGAANESGQDLAFQVVLNSNPGLFSAGPAVDAAGNLTYSPAAQAYGSATIEVRLVDDGGTANGGQDSSAAQTFDIHITPVNDPPSFTKGAGQVVVEDSGPHSVANWATAISAGPGESQALSFSTSLSGGGPALFTAFGQPAISAEGTLTFTPAPNANGSTTVTVFLSDAGGTELGGQDTSSPQTFTITLTAVNDAPSFTPGADPSVVEDGGPQSIAWASAISAGPQDESGQSLSFQVTENSNPDLFSDGPVIDPSGVLTFTPAADANGSASLSVVLSDDGGISNGGEDLAPTVNLTVSVRPVNDPPSFTAGADQAVDEDAGEQSVTGWATEIFTGPGNEAGQSLFFEIANNTNPALFADGPAISPDGTLTYSLAADAHGEAVLEVYARDSGGTADGGEDRSAQASLRITVHPVNDLPVLTPVLAEGQEDEAIPFSAGAFNSQFQDVDGESPVMVRVVSLPVKGGLALGGFPVSAGEEIPAGSLGSLRYTPHLDENGADGFSWNATDGTDWAASISSVEITIHPVNDPPTLNGSIAKDGQEDTSLAFTLEDFSAHFNDVDGDPLAKIKIVWLPGYGSLELNGAPVTTGQEIDAADIPNLAFEPAGNWSGSTGFLWNASDGVYYTATNSSVTLDIAAVVDPPYVYDFSKSGAEDTTILFAASDFIAHFSNMDGGSLQKIQITSLPKNGALVLNGTPVAEMEEIAAADLGVLAFVPQSNWSGTTSWGWNGHDGVTYAAQAASVTLNIGAVNDPPQLTDASRSGDEDSPILFAGVDFSAHFSDTEGASLAKVKIVGLPANGSLLTGGEAVVRNQEIAAADLDGLVFAPNADWNGTTLFWWNGSDGSAYASDFAAFDLVVAAVNDPPSLEPIEDILLPRGSGTKIVNLTGISTGAANEGDTLTITAESSDPGLVAHPTVQYTSPASTAALAFTASETETGMVTIMVRVRDGQPENGEVVRTFLVNPIGFTLDPSSGLATSEAGGQASFSVRLNSEPAAQVVLSLSSSDASEGQPNPSQLTFDPSNWSEPQKVMVSGVDDEVDDGDLAYLIQFGAAASADPNYNGKTAGDVALTNQDDDTAGMAISTGGDLVTSEDGGVASFDVTLASQPVAEVTVTLSSSDPGEGWPAPPTLTLTPEDWSRPQTVTVTGSPDDIDDDTADYTITIQASSPGDPVYQALPAQSVAVANTDVDAAGIRLTPEGGLVTSEGGGTASLSLTLESKPVASVMVSLFSSDGGEGSVAPGGLVFTAENWSTPQQVTISGINDAYADGDQAYTITVRTQLEAQIDLKYKALPDQLVGVTNLDDDTAGFSITPATTPGSRLLTSEASGASHTASLTIAVNTRPQADVVIHLAVNPVAGRSDYESTLSNPTLVFTPSSYGSQTVTVTGVDDHYDDGHINYTITASVDPQSGDPAYRDLPSQTIYARNLDNDTAGIVVNASELTTTEAGGKDTFTIVLGSAPASPVSFNLSSLNGSEGTVSPSKVTFTADNWSKAQTVTVKGVDDPDCDGDVGYQLQVHAAVSDDSNYDGLGAKKVAATNLDNDTAGVTITPLAQENPPAGLSTPLFTTESGGLAAFRVVLTTRPKADVVFAVSSSDTSEGVVDQSSLRFTYNNWNTPQTIHITGKDDPADDENVIYSIQLGAAASTDADYKNRFASQVLVTNLDDDDSPGIKLSATELVTNETGIKASVRISLTGQPLAGEVIVDLVPSFSGEGKLSKTSLTFTKDNWRDEQRVDVTGLDDTLADGNVLYRIEMFTNRSTDQTYRDLDTSKFFVEVVNQDNETAGFIFIPSSGTTYESGSTITFQVKPASRLYESVLAPLSVSHPREGLIDIPALSFTPENWQIAQTVTLTSTDDLIDDGNVHYTIQVGPTVSGDPHYHGLIQNGPDLVNKNDDRAGIAISAPGGSSTSEIGGLVTFNVALNTQPEEKVIIELRSSNPGEATVKPAKLVFTSETWHQPQMVTVQGVPDGVEDGDQAFEITIDPGASLEARYAGLPVEKRTFVNRDSAGIFYVYLPVTIR